ncbi:hypothetical protein ONZ43_g1144 [Nemania bipapillata]|uniref:Uncharacterized protein n=1 Tax=Nemania bipapillata TaxID=110536 RepID=A0ACC2J6C8_9PEZI|nr:hypothetical protein ONZ43_g1144 [Nemania bipapillata]
MEASQAFNLFPKLPAELRLEIWRFALSRPSVILVTLARDPPLENLRPEDPNIGPLYELELVRCGWDPATIGQVCHEARCAMSGMFERLARPLMRGQRQCLVNFESTIFYFHDQIHLREYLQLWEGPLFSNLKQACMGWTNFDYKCMWLGMLASVCPNIRTIFFFGVKGPVEVVALPLYDIDIPWMEASFYKDTAKSEALLLECGDATVKCLEYFFHSFQKLPRLVLTPRFDQLVS